MFSVRYPTIKNPLLSFSEDAPRPLHRVQVAPTSAIVIFVIAAVLLLSPLSWIGTRIDDYVLALLSGFSHRSEGADKFVTVFLSLRSVKLLPIVALAWGLWFLQKYRHVVRAQIITGLGGLFASFACGRALQDWAAYRPRPIHSGNSLFVAPYGVDLNSLEKWSSFPSDHAVISFALATIVFRISRPLGLLCYLWSTFVVCLPRVYGGLHYSSDVAAGALLGTGVVLLAYRFLLPDARLVTRVLAIEERHPSLFYFIAFAFSYPLVTMFDDVRQTAQTLAHVLTN